MVQNGPVPDVQDDQRQARPHGRRRGWSFRFGVGLVLAGLSILGWVGWQLDGTDLVG